MTRILADHDLDEGKHTPERSASDCDACREDLVALCESVDRKARLDERANVATSNYAGKTFSDATDWQYEYGIFETENDERIAELTNWKEQTK
ncbi:hypothetical protein [Williamsia sterculiae]|uniref:hypothetical protein n=1 Tax=Williamsia sterculiae TaxID=1344003 RepID=UPI000970EB8D|nr:hypothetical protein [Williamsia sterculiae]